MTHFELSDDADNDLLDIWGYIATQRSIEVADRVLDTLYEVMGQLSHTPGAGRTRDEVLPGIRSFASGNYVIFYQVIEEGIRIRRVLHGARNINSSLFEEDEEA